MPIIEVTITGHQTKETLAGATCVLPISIGQDYHEGVAFAETLLQLNSTFARIVIVVADTLQRNTLIINGVPPEQAEVVALRKGSEWLERNKDAINALTIPHEIVRWNEYLHNPEYSNKKSFTDSKYQQDADFQNSVDLAADEFVGFLAAKAVKAKKAIKAGAAELLCKEYVLEEAAVIALWMQQGHHYMAYPVSRSQTNKQIFDCLSKMYEAEFQLLDIKIEEKTIAASSKRKTFAATVVAKKDNLSEDQQTKMNDLEKIITQPFISQLFSLSKGHMLESDELKIAFLLSIEEQVKIACTQLVEQMSTRQLAEQGMARKNSVTESTPHPSKETARESMAAPLSRHSSPILVSPASAESSDADSGTTSNASSLSEVSASLQARISDSTTSRSRSNSRDSEVLQAHYSANKSALYQQSQTTNSALTSTATPYTP